MSTWGLKHFISSSVDKQAKKVINQQTENFNQKMYKSTKRNKTSNPPSCRPNQTKTEE
jgi:hypothetical protein